MVPYYASVFVIIRLLKGDPHTTVLPTPYRYYHQEGGALSDGSELPSQHIRSASPIQPAINSSLDRPNSPSRPNPSRAHPIIPSATPQPLPEPGRLARDRLYHTYNTQGQFQPSFPSFFSPHSHLPWSYHNVFSALSLAAAALRARSYFTLVSPVHIVPRNRSQNVKKGCEKLVLMPQLWWWMSW